jgi:hypothetical protein
MSGPQQPKKEKCKCLYKIVTQKLAYIKCKWYGTVLKDGSYQGTWVVPAYLARMQKLTCSAMAVTQGVGESFQAGIILTFLVVILFLNPWRI